MLDCDTGLSGGGQRTENQEAVPFPSQLSGPKPIATDDDVGEVAAAIIRIVAAQARRKSQMYLEGTPPTAVRLEVLIGRKQDVKWSLFGDF